MEPYKTIFILNFVLHTKKKQQKTPNTLTFTPFKVHFPPKHSFVTGFVTMTFVLVWTWTVLAKPALSGNDLVTLPTSQGFLEVVASTSNMRFYCENTLYGVPFQPFL